MFGWVSRKVDGGIVPLNQMYLQDYLKSHSTDTKSPAYLDSHRAAAARLICLQEHIWPLI